MVPQELHNGGGYELRCAAVREFRTESNRTRLWMRKALIPSRSGSREGEADIATPWLYKLRNPL